MQLAAITDEISQDFEHALDVLREYGATGAELRGLWGTNIADLSDAQVARADAAMRERGIRPVCLATPFFKCDLDPAEPNPGEAVGRMHLAQPRGLEQQMEMLQRCIAIAHRLAVPYLRIFSFWKRDRLTPQIEARIVEALQEPVALAARAGVTLLLENEHACYIGTGQEAARVAAAVNSPHLRLVWDPGNAFCAGETPYPDGYLAVRPYLAHMHVKDARMVDTPHHGRQPEWCVIGEGDIDYAGQFAALKQDGYTGYVSLETHYIPEAGSGENGRGTAEDGSRLCLAALQRFLA
ncbi:MAG: sugar phosphate isomerase/epimerase family protein [Chloroherpetonaceae bacterium]|nr:sugar phosphate isomerase/epimerase [Chthonomonadaceae bacterium]MDW8208059.1 sugar phosphate isomerase/epimerase family protein [Chloroherpetonaceae bacterium]